MRILTVTHAHVHRRAPTRLLWRDRTGPGGGGVNSLGFGMDGGVLEIYRPRNLI